MKTDAETVLAIVEIFIPDKNVHHLRGSACQ